MANQGEYLGELQVAIEAKYQCKSTHLETVFVHEKMEKNETVWSGYVEVFDITGHPEAQICYAWRHIEAGTVRVFTLLGNHIINSARRAIQAAIFLMPSRLRVNLKRIWNFSINAFSNLKKPSMKRK